ncbi:ABC transporter permease [Streptosporangium sp. KLBMP 9127]|nr:ABC transporter permease [Streptosporangium sp. KLBMP 9127]
MKVWIIAGMNLRRTFSERTNAFFMIAMPFLMIFVMGLLFGPGQQLRLGVAGGDQGPLARDLVTALTKGERVAVEPFGGADALRQAVERGEVQGGLLIPAGYDAGLRGGGGAEVRYLSRASDLRSLDLTAWVRSVVPQEAAVLRAARLGPFDESLAAARRAEAPGVEVKVSTAGEAIFPEGLGAFSVSAPSLVLLYTFLSSLTAAVGLVALRRSGIARRMYATPTPARTLVAGEALGRLFIALAQGLLIMLGSALLFGVDWGDPLGAAALLVLFAMVGGGAAMLLGSLFDKEGPVSSAALIIGMGLAGAGGTMVPLESLGETMRSVARFTPHAWGYEGFAELVRHGAGVTGILPQLGVLAGFAAVLFSAGVWALRRALIRP